MSLSEWLPEEAIRTHATAADWRAAIELSGEALVAAGVTSPDYTNEMIATVEKLGPYIVIAPGLALAHSRPSPAVNRAGLSWITLDTPVEFGAGENDPVDLVIGLAALDHDGHLALMSELARVLSDEEGLARLRAADSASDVRRILDDVSES
ncbi:PTS sugar transporter subunit IIA [Microbacterium koreense]|uniref:Ascorbate-specific PTS system EIIA component n=1 Tax=Microbacterium koreense TaxID=323761 RepID=A0ABW2ZUI5_9MICO